MFVLKHKPSGKFERYASYYDPDKEWTDYRGNKRKGYTEDLTDNINEAKTYGAERSCQNSNAWNLPDYEFVEIQVSTTGNVLTPKKK